MLEPLADALALILDPCYALTGNWWISILLFTIIVKIILLPMSLWCQKNSIVMVQLMPDLFRIKVKYFGDTETIGEKQNQLYKDRHYHPLLSLIPLAVQILILFGLVDVIHTITDGGAPGTEFLGQIPTTDGGLSWIMPLLAGLSAVIMGFAQNRINPLQKEQSRAEKNMTNGLSIGLSFVLGVFVAAGMAFYWICSNLTSIAIQALCNILIKPRKYIDYADLTTARNDFEALQNIGKADKLPWYRPNPLAKRERADYKRFMNTVNKHLVVFSERSGFYKYFEGTINYLLAHTDGIIHYVTEDPNDQIFALAAREPRLRPYYISEKKCITLFMKMDADVVLLTLEDFGNYYLKRSYVRSDIEYVFTFHHMTSTHLVSAQHAFDHFDTILCVGPQQARELRAAEALYGLPARNLVEVGSTLLEHNIASYLEGQTDAERDATQAADSQAQGAERDASRTQRTILIAPSWQEGNILDSCIDTMLEALLSDGWNVVVRPHPEYVKRYRPRWDALCARYANDDAAAANSAASGDAADITATPRGSVVMQSDFSSNSTVYTADVLVTDWSSISCEFSFCTLKPTIYIDTPMKVTNPHWEELGITPLDISLRDTTGKRLDPAQAERIACVADELFAQRDEWKSRIEEVRGATIANLGHADKVAGEYLIGTILRKQAARAQAKSAVKEANND